MLFVSGWRRGTFHQAAGVALAPRTRDAPRQSGGTNHRPGHIRRQ